MKQPFSRNSIQGVHGPFAFMLLLGLSSALLPAGILTGSIDPTAPSDDPNFGTFLKTVTDTTIIGFSGSTTGTTNGISSLSHGSFLVDYGYIKLSGATGGGGAQVSGRFQDSMVFSAPGVPDNTAGTFVYNLLIAGLLEAGIYGSNSDWGQTAAVGTNLNRPPPNNINASGLFRGCCFNPGYQGDPFGTYSATVNFLYGVPIIVDVRLGGFAQGGSANTDPNNPARITDLSGASFDLSHSLYWGGITSVTEAGNTVTDFTIVSGSGANYANSFIPAVSTPEPASF